MLPPKICGVGFFLQISPTLLICCVERKVALPSDFPSLLSWAALPNTGPGTLVGKVATGHDILVGRRAVFGLGTQHFTGAMLFFATRAVYGVPTEILAVASVVQSGEGHRDQQGIEVYLFLLFTSK